MTTVVDQRSVLRTRVDGVDTARGIALIGMFIAHAAPAAASPQVAQLLAIADERPRLLFALTAGLALGFISGGTRPIPAAPGFAGGKRRATLRLQISIRAVILIALGLIIAATLAPLVFIILDVYGVAFLVMLPLLFLPRWIALGVGIAGLFVAPGLAIMLSNEQWVAEARLTWLQLPIQWLISGAYPVIEWVPVMLIGLALARFGMNRPHVVAWTALVGTVAAIVCLPTGVSLLMGASDPSRLLAAGDPLLNLAVGESLQALGNVGIGALIVAAMVTLTALARDPIRHAASALLSPITAMGAMPFTIYTVHLLVLAGAIRVKNGIKTDDSWPLTIGLIVGSMVFAWCWRRFVGRGPLEYVMRVVSGRARTET